MKVLLINGSPHENGCTYTALSEVASQLNKNGIDTEILYIGKDPVLGCVACGACTKLKKCAFDDDKCNIIAEKMLEADALVIGSPVYFAGPNGALCALLDRAFYFSSGKMAGKPGAAVVSCRRGGASASFDRLNKYFTISNMPVVSSQYWNMVHGMCAEDVLKDEEGLQTMRTLADNMAWMLKNMEAGGIDKPQRERKISTNFIR